LNLLLWSLPLRLGLLGGTFDPIHQGHLEIAETAIRVAALDVVYFVTSVNPPHKSDRTHANFLDRHAMVALALLGHSKLIPSSLEYDRSGKSYSIDTVLQFKEVAGPNSQIFFLIGMDAFLDLPAWKDYERFTELCSFLVFARPGYDESALAGWLPKQFQIKHLKLNQPQKPNLTAQTGLFVLSDFASPISSTDLRSRVRNRQPISQWVSSHVEEYISKTGLYIS
jgi:nicotinate-nucleotide adenylyltransferase